MFPRLLLLLVCIGSVARPVPAQPLRAEAIDRVWSGNDTRFALAVGPERIFVGYYDAARQLTIASRHRKDPASWRFHKLDSWLGWDSHNYIALAVDGAGALHVAANMHNDPLNYYRTEPGGGLATLQRVPVMTATAVESRVTYPVFLRAPDGRLIFKYRQGGSGNGDERYNIYDTAQKRWSALLGVPLIDGERRRNAYPVGPVLGPDGRFHLVWVWRDTPDAATNHDLSYARSSNLVDWQRSDGTPTALPIRLADAEIVDPVPVGRGMINNNTVLGFDAQKRPVITFHKFDANGGTQIFLARREASGWHIAQASRWSGFRWDFGGGGSLASRLYVSGAVAEGDRLRVRVVRDGIATDLLVDAGTLAPVAERRATTLGDRLRPAIELPRGMILNTLEDAGGQWAIAWPSRPANRDRPTADMAEPTTLRLIELH